MNSKEIRNKFTEFFRQKQHAIVPSAPMVLKDDPTLMFTNAGMNQFKDIFLGNNPAKHPRIANSQKCLRVSGKHNDLEEVGHDTYHHTMFEMLGNWSFGDYFKKEAIDFAWEFLVGVLHLDPSVLYATVFEGSPEENIEKDTEALTFWKKYLPENQILTGNKKDNFWEMGDTGPCGPCSEIHIDLRPAAEQAVTPGWQLVNTGNPLVIEIWNLVFIQFNRKSDGSLEALPQKHVDTGMGFERLCMAVQGKKSNYDTDVFQPVIAAIARQTDCTYGQDNQKDIAMRVIADHLRAVSFAIADGQLPSNAKAGYVIRRILRRAIRYNFTFLEQKDPSIYRLLPSLIEVMGDAYPELKSQERIIREVIREEERSFLKTLESGIKLLANQTEAAKTQKSPMLDGKQAFILYDTYGFPVDLTELILREQGMTLDIEGFHREMELQKERSRSAAGQDTGDWIVISESQSQPFVGYVQTAAEICITRYRTVKSQKETLYHLVFDQTPFYAESGGQVGDTGFITNGRERIDILDTKKENNLNIHIAGKLPQDLSSPFQAVVENTSRNATAAHHSATHLLHYALRQVLGSHVEQKGSLVCPDYLRFDFAHFQKITPEEILKIEALVNNLIRRNTSLEELTDVPIDEAKNLGAMALFGEKYGESVRVIKFGESIELCGGTHVGATGEIGLIKILSEGSISAGIRRIQAVAGAKAEEHLNGQLVLLSELSAKLGSPADPVKALEQLIEQNQAAAKKLEELENAEVKRVKKSLLECAERQNDLTVIAGVVELPGVNAMKNLAYQLKGEVDDLLLVLGAEIDGKAHLTIMIADNVLKSKGLHAGKLIKEAATSIQGGGGGQPFYATAGGKNVSGLQKAVAMVLEAAANS